jgi:putative ABC transport system permease protein
MYYVDPVSTFHLFAMLQGQRLPETLQSIDALWRSTGHVRPIKLDFLGETMRQAYRDVRIQGGIIGASAGLAIVIACLGLFALAAFTAERRTREIGVRKAVGASSFDVVRLLLWQFTKPVLWANLVAWPLAYWAAAQWLNGFAYRVSLPSWLFLSASIVAVLVAWVAVAAKAWQAAHAKPAAALQCE